MLYRVGDIRLLARQRIHKSPELYNVLKKQHFNPFRHTERRLWKLHYGVMQVY